MSPQIGLSTTLAPVNLMELPEACIDPRVLSVRSVVVVIPRSDSSGVSEEPPEREQDTLDFRTGSVATEEWVCGLRPMPDEPLSLSGYAPLESQVSYNAHGLPQDPPAALLVFGGHETSAKAQSALLNKCFNGYPIPSLYRQIEQTNASPVTQSHHILPESLRPTLTYPSPPDRPYHRGIYPLDVINTPHMPYNQPSFPSAAYNLPSHIHETGGTMRTENDDVPWTIKRVPSPTPRRHSVPSNPTVGKPKTAPRRRSNESRNEPPAAELQFVGERGDGKVIYGNGEKTRGRRYGPLSLHVRANAKRVRLQKTICIRCRKDHQPCDGFGFGPCTRCQILGTTAAWSQPCTKADFLNIVEGGTSNYISQRAINHQTLDGRRRVRIDLAETLNLDHILASLDTCRRVFDIRVTQASEPLYVLNLDRCHAFLSSIRERHHSSTFDFRRFIDQDILEAQSWEQCINDRKPLEDLMGCLSIWGNMPSRASYSYVPRRHRALPQDLPDRAMDVESVEDRESIVLAAQLSRIVCRKLEVDAYANLQNTLNQWSRLSSAALATQTNALGALLLTLRWRVSWWMLLGDGGAISDNRAKAAYEERVHGLCRRLYFYYCMLHRKLAPWGSTWADGRSDDGVIMVDGRLGKWSTYADTSKPIFDDFPCEESLEGYDAWMRRGRELIVAAGVASKLVGIGLIREKPQLERSTSPNKPGE